MFIGWPHVYLRAKDISASFYTYKILFIDINAVYVDLHNLLQLKFCRRKWNENFKKYEEKNIFM